MEKRKGNYIPGPGRPKGRTYTIQLSFKVTKELHDYITARAESLDISAAEYLRRLIEQDMEGKG